MISAIVRSFPSSPICCSRNKRIDIHEHVGSRSHAITEDRQRGLQERKGKIRNFLEYFIYTQPSSTQPLSTQSSSTQPPSTQPASTQPTPTQPSSAQPSSTETFTSEHPEDQCQDHPTFTSNCKGIAIAGYCKNKHYAKYCCRSCTLAGKDGNYLE